jgi:hypothetical protein
MMDIFDNILLFFSAVGVFLIILALIIDIVAKAGGYVHINGSIKIGWGNNDRKRKTIEKTIL